MDIIIGTAGTARPSGPLSRARGCDGGPSTIKVARGPFPPVGSPPTGRSNRSRALPTFTGTGRERVSGRCRQARLSAWSVPVASLFILGSGASLAQALQRSVQATALLLPGVAGCPILHSPLAVWVGSSACQNGWRADEQHMGAFRRDGYVAPLAKCSAADPSH